VHSAIPVTIPTFSLLAVYDHCHVGEPFKPYFMDYLFNPNRLPSPLVPFVTLSYPVEPSVKPDSIPNSSYYEIGYRDICLIISLISMMAILRDAARVLLLEPFANWTLTRDWRRRQASKSGSSTPDLKASVNNFSINANGKGNGSPTTIGSTEKLVADRPAENSPEARRIRHAVIRFAEQGWQAIYYLVQWSLGLVRVPYHLLLTMPLLQISIFTITCPRTSGLDILTYPSLV
jgi:very-long-chain ceramide synthase